MKQPEIQEHYDPDKALVDEGQLRGGKITLADTTARDNWPLDKRKIGMFVTIGTDTKRYGGADVTNTNWTDADNWFSILDKEYGDTLYKRRGTEFIVKEVTIDKNLVKIDVYKIAGLYMNGRFAFNVVAYTTDPTPEKKVEIEILPVDASKFNVKGITDGFTGKATLFVTFQEIIWDYEGVVTVGNSTGNYGYVFFATNPIYNFGSITPVYPKTETGTYAGHKSVYFQNSNLLRITGDVVAVMINGVAISWSGKTFYENLSVLIIASNPFTAVGSLCPVKIKFA